MNQILSVSHSFSRACAFAFTLGMFGTLAAPCDDAHAESTVIYKETYQYCTASLGKPAADETGWLGLVTGLPKEKFSNLKVFSYGSTIIGGSVNSTPQGKAEGYSFWFKPAYGVSFLTAEFPFDVGLISKNPSSIEYEQRLSGVDAAGVMNQTQLIFLIDDTWYISGTATRQSSPFKWEPVKLDPSELLYGTVPYVNGLGAATPAAYNTSLPMTGTVRAFGVFLAEVNGRVRVDNFTISTSGPIPDGVSTAVVATSVTGCPATSPDVTGVVVPTPTPDPDDSDGGTDNGTPPTPVPTGTPTSIPTPRVNTAEFCSTKEQGAGLRVRVAPRFAKAFVSKGIGRGTIALRNRALAHLYASRVMPVGALVNVRIGDFNPAKGTLKVSLKKGRAPSRIKLSRPAQTSLKRYLSAIRPHVNATDPMFGAVVARSVNVKKAVCTSELKRVLATRAKAAKLSTKRIYMR